MDEPLATLVTDWLTLQEAAEQLGTSVSRLKVRARDHELAVAGARGGWLPALFIDETGVVKGLPGTLTLLFDAGYDPPESIRWLYTADDSLPGRPIDALCENRGAEVRRRAQALGF
ncbi:MAG: Rv2175c family DNA-binding protein [Actinomycetota bacterium]|nr:Rv2175c family DNA-binding protein [Actinomycetota bacterium]